MPLVASFADRGNFFKRGFPLCRFCNGGINPKTNSPRNLKKNPAVAENCAQRKMNTDNGNKEIIDRLQALESAIRSLNDLVLGLVEPENLAQIYTLSELAERWKCSQTQARLIVKSYGLKVVLGANKTPRKPLSVFKSEVIKYEQAEFTKEQKKPCFIPAYGKTARGFRPFRKCDNQGKTVETRVRRLGE